MAEEGLAKNLKQTFRILLAGGGTGGHLYPAIAIAEEILRREPNAEIHFVGTRVGLEARVLPSLGYKLHFSAIRGFRRKLTIKNLWLPFRVMVSSFQCLSLLYKVGPHVVIGTGGYVSGPTLFFAWLMRVPTLIQEQNSYPGATTRFLSRLVDRVHLSYEESKKYFRSHDKLRVSGNPVRSFRRDVDKNEARQRLQLEPERVTLLVFGGSQGARAINRVMAQIAEKIVNNSEAQIVWGTGRLDYSKVVEETRGIGSRLKIFEYIDDMGMAYSASDVIVSRAGATTLAEITLWGLPSILIPYPYAAAGHQESNARTLENLGAAFVILEKDLDDSSLLTQVLELLKSDKLRHKMGSAARAASHPNAAKEIVDSLFELAGKS